MRRERVKSDPKAGANRRQLEEEKVPPQDMEAYHIMHAAFLAVPLVLGTATLAIYLTAHERRRQRAGKRP